MATIYLIRHAEPAPPHEWPGSNDTRPLTTKGQRQAQWMAEYLRDKQISGIKTSPLARCVETASIIGEALELKPVEDPQLHIWSHFSIDAPEENHVWVAHSNNIPDAVYKKGVSCMSCAHASAWSLSLDKDGNVTGHEYIAPEVQGD